VGGLKHGASSLDALRRGGGWAEARGQHLGRLATWGVGGCGGTHTAEGIGGGRAWRLTGAEGGEDRAVSPT
jgi:hypothetical protein